jgi:hypothetical protein
MAADIAERRLQSLTPPGSAVVVTVIVAAWAAELAANATRLKTAAHRLTDTTLEKAISTCLFRPKLVKGSRFNLIFARTLFK